eukprot:12606625-Alexandrium_andersonii.AAC.1
MLETDLEGDDHLSFVLEVASVPENSDSSESQARVEKLNMDYDLEGNDDKPLFEDIDYSSS